MHVGTGYRLIEFLIWTRRSIYGLLIVSAFPVILYQILGWRWVALPWTVVAMLGTAAAFLVGFKNTQTYNRTWEARQIWGAILNLSRAFLCLLSVYKTTNYNYLQHNWLKQTINPEA